MYKIDNDTRELFATIRQLPDEKRMVAFFRDLLTEAEITEFSKRWQAAQMLARSVSYQTIVQQTGLSSRTIARISKWLSDGEGGYRYALDNLVHSHNHTKSASPAEV